MTCARCGEPGGSIEMRQVTSQITGVLRIAGVHVPYCPPNPSPAAPAGGSIWDGCYRTPPRPTLDQLDRIQDPHPYTGGLAVVL